MRRGFKAEAERIATYQWQLLGLSSSEPLLARKLAKHHQVLVATPEGIPGMTIGHICQLLQIDERGWSALTIFGQSQSAIVHNPRHDKGRQETNLAHEIAHILCKHQPTQLINVLNLPFILRTYDTEQEQEADWLAGCLKLPRKALLWAVQRGMKDDTIANHFRASLQLVQYRRRITGVDKQVPFKRSI